MGVVAEPGTKKRGRVSFLGKKRGRVSFLFYGTNGGSSLSRPSTVPYRADTVLVTSSEYDDTGELEFSTDPAGMETRFEYDDAGRQTKTKKQRGQDSLMG